MRRILTALLVVAAAGCGGAGSPAAGRPPAQTAPAASSTGLTSVPLPPGASASRVDAIAAVIARTSNPTDGFVAFRDTSDAVSGGPERLVQMSCDGTACHFEALCDKTPLTCDRIAPGLEGLGLQPDKQNPGVYFLDRNGTAPDFARLTETVYLRVLGASPAYRLSWRSNRQTTEVPVQP